MILITIVLIFMVCSIPRVVINGYEVYHLIVKQDLLTDWPTWCDNVSSLSHLLLVINSSINIVIYTVKDDKFRNILKNMFITKSKIFGGTVNKRGLTNNSLRFSFLSSGSATDTDGQLRQSRKMSTHAKSPEIKISIDTVPLNRKQ